MPNGILPIRHLEECSAPRLSQCMLAAYYSTLWALKGRNYGFIHSTSNCQPCIMCQELELQRWTTCQCQQGTQSLVETNRYLSTNTKISAIEDMWMILRKPRVVMTNSSQETQVRFSLEVWKVYARLTRQRELPRGTYIFSLSETYMYLCVCENKCIYTQDC